MPSHHHVRNLGFKKQDGYMGYTGTSASPPGYPQHQSYGHGHDVSTQPRVPAGNSNGGQWTAAGTGSLIRDPGEFAKLVFQVGLNQLDRETLTAVMKQLQSSPLAYEALREIYKEKGVVGLAEMFTTVLEPPKPFHELMTSNPPAGFNSRSALMRYLRAVPESLLRA